MFQRVYSNWGVDALQVTPVPGVSLRGAVPGLLWLVMRVVVVVTVMVGVPVFAVMV